MILRAYVTALLGLWLTAAPAHAGENLAAWYAFDEGAGAVVADKSGKGNTGKVVGNVKWVKGDFGNALEFDGKTTYVDCGAAESLDIGSGGTVSVWCRPRALQGGVVNWSTGSGWDDERLVIAFNTYGDNLSFMGCFGAPKVYQQLRGFVLPTPDEWMHVAIAFDGKTIEAYRDGVPCLSATEDTAPEIKGVPLWIGRCQGLGKDYFDGLISEVRIYRTALSTEEVLALYKRDAGRRGKDTTFFTRPRIDAQAHPDFGRIAATLDAQAMRPLPNGIILSTELCGPSSAQPSQRDQTAPLANPGPVDVLFDAQRLPPGEYVIRSAVFGPNKARIGEVSETKVNWPGPSPAMKGVEVLNCLVWELLNVKAEGNQSLSGPLTFNNPCDRWILIRTTAEIRKGGMVWVFVDTQEAPAISHAEGIPLTLEAMHFLKAGRHTLTVKREGGGVLRQIVVRSIPMLQHAFYGADPHIAPYGPYDWAFLKKDVLPNVNTMIGTPGPELEQWKKSGRKWIAITNVHVPSVRSVRATDPAAVQTVYNHWAASPGVQNPLMDGVIVDEFGGGDDPIYDVYRKAVERLYAAPQFKGKMYIPYGGSFYGPDRSREFAKAALEGGGYVASEIYLQEESTEAAGRAALRRFADGMKLWEKGLPGVTRKMVIVYGYMSQPNESLNVNPLVDFRVWMDMQMRELATNPAFFGLGGIQEYHSSYCDEENVRLAGRLLRHYAIEGNTQPLITDPYRLAHIQNPDFDKGTTGWTVSPAEAGSIQAKEERGLSWLEGRYPPTPLGNTFLWMKRSDKKPNVFSQPVMNLTPGRLYSMKMMTADYQNLLQERSVKALDAVTIKLDNVEILSGPKNSFQFTFPNCYAHVVGKFNAKYPFWMNYHWRVFRAKSATARLAVSDWASEKDPGGPVGQELMYNFIEIQPYMGD